MCTERRRQVSQLVIPQEILDLTAEQFFFEINQEQLRVPQSPPHRGLVVGGIGDLMCCGAGRRRACWRWPDWSARERQSPRSSPSTG
ncbi:MAG: hypothetical protein ACRDRU_15385 [Pseudonocardiaceae bacterium]